MGPEFESFPAWSAAVSLASDRRDFLRRSSVVAAAALFPFDSLRRRIAAGDQPRSAKDYGPLRAARDATTGLDLLKLPPDFRYLSFGWTGDRMDDARPTPPLHDGMAVVGRDGDQCVLIRNHEIDSSGAPIVPVEAAYDPRGAGGCTRLVFDCRSERLVAHAAALGGTVKNCAGGPTPHGSWLSCEETVLGPGDVRKGKRVDFEKPHGFVFEVPGDGGAVSKPIVEMGRFVHEAVAIDLATGVVYLTEDQDETAGFYRFLPKDAGRLADGGRLQMMAVPSQPDLRAGVPLDRPFDVSWVDVDDPSVAHSPNGPDGLGVFTQGRGRGGATFARLEGAWYGCERVFFCSTSGGDAKLGQVFEFDPARQTLRLVFESPAPEVLSGPDNVTVSPRGGVLLCEDSDAAPQRLMGLTPAGEIFPFAENAIQLAGAPNGFRGDFRDQEWCGATFSPDGQWLFVNIQNPGVTFAITGPWDRGSL
jgi:secreted PhoX family phosphatase